MSSMASRPTARPMLLHPVRDASTGASTVVLPSLRAALAHALPHLIEGVAGPFAIFYLVLLIAGFKGALYAAVGWSFVAIVRRLVTRQPVPGTLWLSFGLLGVRTVIALLTKSAFIYFLQPTLGTVLVGVVFLVSAGARRPFIQRLAQDFMPFSRELLARHGIRRFFTQISLLWAAVLLTNAAVVLALLVTTSLRAFVLERTAVSWTLSLLAVGASFYAFRRALRRENIHLRFSLR